MGCGPLQGLPDKLGGKAAANLICTAIIVAIAGIAGEKFRPGIATIFGDIIPTTAPHAIALVTALEHDLLTKGLAGGATKCWLDIIFTVALVLF